MSHGYRLVQWTAFKRRYDAWMLTGMAAYLSAFVAGSVFGQPDGESFTLVQILIRATGTLALLMFGVLLCIGPLSRWTSRARPFLYNRRHLGVATFLTATVHAVLVLVWYHGWGVLNPFESLLVSNVADTAPAGLPFEWPGALAWLLMALLAATSHDFWNDRLGPRLWKALHLAAYPAFALLVAHVALGAWQSEPGWAAGTLLVIGCVTVAVLQIGSARQGSAADRHAAATPSGFVVGPASALVDGQGLVIEPPGQERIAVFRIGDQVTAVANVCPHQGGPLGEGRIVDGLITCPWHGHQFGPDGCAPPPFTDRVPTYDTQIVDGQVIVALQPRPAGCPASTSRITGDRP